MRYFIGFVAVVILVVGVFILVLKGFSGGSHTPKKNEITLTDYADSETTVKMEVDGPIVADQNHQGYSITVGRDATTIEVTKGYDKQVVKAQTYSNNSKAYADFLRALQLQNYTKGIQDTSREDIRGFCPAGDRFIYTVENGGNDVQNYWTSTCGGGTFKGNANSIRNLFAKQVPDFNSLTADVRL
jgi:hypothetical protein